MRRQNRLAAVVIVGAAVFAACLGNLTLSTVEQHTMSYPGSASAGNVMVGQSGTTPAIVFTPATPQDNDRIITITANCVNWTLNFPSPLPADVYCDLVNVGGSQTTCVPQSYSFTGTFTPTGAGSDSCPVTVVWRSNVSGSAGSNSTFLVVLNGTGVAPSYSLEVSPAMGTPLEYSDIPVNTTSSAQVITVTNDGTSPLTVVGSNSDPVLFPLMPVGGANFSIQALQPQQSVQYSVACHPPAATDYAGTITFMTGPAQGNLVSTVSLECNGIVSDLDISPTPASFARGTLVGRSPPEIDITITNHGAGAVNLNASLESGSAVEITAPPVSPLAKDASTSVRLRYTAVIAHPFGVIDRLLINAGAGPQMVAINAEALIGEIGVSPGIVEFGPVCPGSDRTAELMVYATSSGPVTLTSITPPGAPFSVTGMGGDLVPNHGNIIPLTARMSANTPGELEDVLVLNTNLPGSAAMREVHLSGVALPPGITPTPGEVAFGLAPIGAPTTAKAVTVSNCGTSPLAITGARIEGPNAREFTIVSPADPVQMVPVLGELEFLVIMNPASAGAKSATLVVEHADGRIEVDLDGSGFAADGGGDKSTYYTCSAGGAAGGLPVVLGVLVLRRRRRAIA